MAETMYDLQFKDVDRTTWFLIRQVSRLMSRALDRSLRNEKVTPEYLIILWILPDCPGPKKEAEIARLMSVRPNTMVGFIDRMEADGLVQRVLKRRGQPFTEGKLTAKGQEACERGLPLLKEAFGGALNGLTPHQLEHLNGLLKILRDGVAEDLYIEVEPVPGWG